MRFLAIILLLCVSVSATAQKNGKEVLAKAIEAMKSHKSLGYTAQLRVKRAQTDDTTTNTSEVYLIRDERDKALGGMAWQSDGLSYGHYSFYNLEMRYIVMIPQRKVWREQMDHNRMGLRAHNQELFFDRFLKPGEFLKDPYQKIEMLKDTVIDNQLCYRVRTKLASGFGNIGPIEQTWYFSKKDMFPILNTYIVTIDGGLQYTELKFITHDYDNVSEERFSPKQIPADYTFDFRGPGEFIDARERK